MIATGMFVRLALFLPVLWLVMVVYAGLKHDDAVGTIRAANAGSVKALTYLVLIAVGMFVIEWLFID